MTPEPGNKPQPLSTLERLLKVAVWIFGSALMLVAVTVSVEVVLRQIFDFGSIIGIEYSGYILAVSSAFAFPFTLLKRGHVRVDFIKFVSPRIEIFADMLAILSMLFLAICLTVFAFGVFSQSLSLGAVSSSPLETPLWLPQGLWFLGLLVFSLIAAVVLFAALFKLLRGEIADASALISTPSIKEEIEEVAHDWSVDEKD